MEYRVIPAVPDSSAGGVEGREDGLNLGAWFQRGWSTATGVGEKGTDFVAGVLDRFREADALAYDNDADEEGEQNEN